MKDTSMASGTAFMKAIEYLAPRELRLFEDKYSKHFMSPMYRFFYKLMTNKTMYRWLMGFREKSTPGVVGALMSRVRFIDDLLKNLEQGGFKSVVNLGSGYDTRILRLSDLSHVVYYEVDGPGVVESKKKIIEDLKVKYPMNLQLLAMDFNKDNLNEKLSSVGFEQNGKTFFIWEGVTQYITKEAMKDTLKFISECGRGSSLVFTYMDASVVNQPEKYPDSNRLIRQFSLMGLNICAHSSDEIHELVSSLGMEVVADIGSKEYTDMYGVLKKRGLSVTPLERTAHVRVKG